MAKDTIIDPEWEKENELRGNWGTRPRPRREEPEDLDPFGEKPQDGYAIGPGPAREPEPPFEPDPQPESVRRDTGHPGPESVRRENASRPEPEPDPFAQPEEDRVASKTKAYIGMLLSGSILTRTEVRRSYPYLIFVAFLMLLYISSVFRMQQLHRREQELSRQVKELRAMSLELASERMNATRQSHIISELEERGIPLKESTDPPKIIAK